MEIGAILVIAAIVYTCGSIGLVTVRLTNPFFKGLGWLGGAFAAGASGSILFEMRPDIWSGLAVIVPDTLILLAYVFLHVCILELIESPSLVPKMGIALLTLQASAYPFFRNFPHAEQLCVITLGIVLAVQTFTSAAILKRYVHAGMRAPVWFSITLLIGFGAYNVFRSIVVLVLGIPQNPQFPNPLEVISALVFLGAGLGLAFGMFWMTSAKIRIALEGLANTDPLTGIYNRRIFTELCEQELLRSSRAAEPFSLIMFDLDHFKQINDRYGHISGDAVLCAVVEKLRNAVRNIDAVGRWGGEEFVALLPKADAHAALIVAQRLRHSVEYLLHSVPQTQSKLDVAHNLRVKDIDGEEMVSVTISVGVATYSGQVNTVEELLHQCDRAMYRAKAEGRNRIVLADTPQYALFE